MPLTRENLKHLAQLIGTSIDENVDGAIVEKIKSTGIDTFSAPYFYFSPSPVITHFEENKKFVLLGHFYWKNKKVKVLYNGKIVYFARLDKPESTFRDWPDILCMFANLEYFLNKSIFQKGEFFQDFFAEMNRQFIDFYNNSLFSYKAYITFKCAFEVITKSESEKIIGFLGDFNDPVLVKENKVFLQNESTNELQFINSSVEQFNEVFAALSFFKNKLMFEQTREDNAKYVNFCYENLVSLKKALHNIDPKAFSKESFWVTELNYPMEELGWDLNNSLGGDSPFSRDPNFADFTYRPQ